MRAKLLLMVPVLAAVLPASAQYVTKPDTTSFTVETTLRNGPDGKAQTVSPPRQTIDPTLAPGCPVSMRARRMGGAAAMQAGDRSAPAAGQQIHLEIDRGHHRATEAQVTVHGTRGKAGMVLALSSSDATAAGSAARSFRLKPGAEKGASAAAMIASDLKLAGFTSVTSISLDSITYADGTEWKADARHSCSIEPDPMMLVK